MNCLWCRDAQNVIDKEIINKHDLFVNKHTLTCKFSNEESSKVTYNKDTALFLISLTSQNGGNEEQIQKNVTYAKSNGVNHYLLFDGWYDTLENIDIDAFAEALSKLV